MRRVKTTLTAESDELWRLGRMVGSRPSNSRVNSELLDITRSPRQLVTGSLAIQLFKLVTCLGYSGK